MGTCLPATILPALLPACLPAPHSGEVEDGTMDFLTMCLVITAAAAACYYYTHACLPATLLLCLPPSCLFNLSWGHGSGGREVGTCLPAVYIPYTLPATIPACLLQTPYHDTFTIINKHMHACKCLPCLPEEGRLEGDFPPACSSLSFSCSYPSLLSPTYHTYIT